MYLKPLFCSLFWYTMIDLAWFAKVLIVFVDIFNLILGIKSTLTVVTLWYIIGEICLCCWLNSSFVK